MAIKPNDCIVKISDLVVGQEEYTDWDGRLTKRDRYEQYWRNFCIHLDVLRSKVDWKTMRGYNKDPYTEIEDAELAKFGVKLKRTKEWKGNYLKFKSHKHLTAFILRWS